MTPRHRYAEPRRRYHTLEHIGEMLGLIEEFRDRLMEYEAVSLATWFHDVVYDPGRRDNEERSAALADRTLRRLLVPAWIRARSAALIRATADHISPDRSFDAALFLDADLAILGSEQVRYDRYAADVRTEYAHLSDTEFNRGRRSVLRRLLDRDPIFATTEMRDRLEGSTRENIERELVRLGGADSNSEDLHD